MKEFQLKPMKRANIKRRRKVKIGKNLYESMTQASRNNDCSDSYISMRYRLYDKKMPDGRIIEYVK